jgi:cytochrome c peroxidase
MSKSTYNSRNTGAATLEPPDVVNSRTEEAATRPRDGNDSGRRVSYKQAQYVPFTVAVVCAAVSLPISLWFVFDRRQDSSGDKGRAFDVSNRSSSSRAGEPVQPIIPIDKLDPRLIELGQRLFFDARLSGDGTISCASCHLLSKGGADGRRVSVGISGQLGEINAPTVFNAAFNFRQFWDGRAATLEEQIDGPVENSVEMGSTWAHTIGEISQDAKYSQHFRDAFPDGITRENVKHAIAVYERSLTTPNSRFDRWLRGDDAALTQRELDGYALFKDYQCISCHQGVNFGGTMYQRLGVMAEYFTRDRQERRSDLGRFNVTGDERDRHVFRVPPLRNVAKTAPYFHDGSAKTLQDAIRVMIVDQLGRQVKEDDVTLIAEFLQTLTGESLEGKN